MTSTLVSLLSANFKIVFIMSQKQMQGVKNKREIDVAGFDLSGL